jgi:hypothetical protein
LSPYLLSSLLPLIRSFCRPFRYAVLKYRVHDNRLQTCCAPRQCSKAPIQHQQASCQPECTYSSIDYIQPKKSKLKESARVRDHGAWCRKLTTFSESRTADVMSKAKQRIYTERCAFK